MIYKFMSSTDPAENKKNEWSLYEFLKFVIITLAIIVPLRMYVAQPFVVSGASMSPTFETGQYLIVDQFSYNFSEPERGDVIIFRFPKDPSKFFIKRIIALPSENIIINGEEIKIITRDGEEIILDEPYIKLTKDSYTETMLGHDEYFVMGDNREASLDSRIWGTLEEKYIIGKALFRLLPIGEIDYLPGKFNF
jgi:signal peptidase I